MELPQGIKMELDVEINDRLQNDIEINREARLDILRRYPADQALIYDRAAFGWVVAFYLSLFLTLAGLLWVELFCFVGIVSLIRNFNALHESFHADQRGTNIWRFGRVLPIVVAPWQLGYRELKNNHIYHHRFEGGRDDPDRYLIKGSALNAFVMALTQPEQSVFRYIKRKGLDGKLIFSLTLHAGVWLALLFAMPFSLFFIYNLITRLANTAVWWIFDYWLHQQSIYRFPNPLRPWKSVKLVWRSLFSGSNLNGVLHHYLHHKYPFVPDSALDQLQRDLLELRR